MKRVLDERVELEEKREAAAAKRRAEEAALISGQERKVSLHHFETDSTQGHFSASDEESLRIPILASQRSILILSMYISGLSSAGTSHPIFLDAEKINLHF